MSDIDLYPNSAEDILNSLPPGFKLKTYITMVAASRRLGLTLREVDTLREAGDIDCLENDGRLMLLKADGDRLAHASHA